jgi:uncharacterized protein YsxB (DUF464 family)
MVFVEIARSGGPESPVRRLKVRGHAGFAARGYDIVCAAASVTAYTAAGALSKICGAPRGCAKEREGFFELAVPDFKDRDAALKAEVIMETAYIGYRQIEASYPGYINVTEKISDGGKNA